jgi:hypothetical protein
MNAGAPAPTAARHSDGRAGPAATVARLTLRPGTSPVLGVFFLSVAALFVMLAAELTGSAGLERTAGIVGLAFAEGLDAQLDQLEHEAGVREQL